jgi:hypothetical protein|tara:strand:- start:184 stop:741 length:558 start_codon:yes stop_codon:yes gene_type:complete
MTTDPRYENGVIYTIKTNDGLYVGSTINLYNRKVSHKNRLYNNFKTLLYQNIRANNNEYIIELHKPFPCLNRTQLDMEERKVCEELNANLNTNKAYTSAEEKKHQARDYMKTYIRKRVKCECGIEMRFDNLKRHLQTKGHRDALIAKMGTDLLGYLICPPCENVVITKTNNSHTTPYPSSDEEDL